MTDNETSIEMKVPSDHPSLPGHFPANPVVPGVVILSCLLEGYSRAISAPLRLQQLPRVKFLRPLLAEVAFQVTYRESAGKLKFRGTIDGEPFVVGVMGISRAGE
ncbi:hypothetical protein [Aestuariirhabdus sp. LZHN29]|uniref:hypothetical protein n=1 Tax=Aestuariirhabdus sp. LZHN29 TaxID=3417462 RepID=UPI003CEC16F4